MIVWTVLVAAIMIAGGLNISHFGGGEVLLFILGVLVLVILGLVRALVSRDR